MRPLLHLLLILLPLFVAAQDATPSQVRGYIMDCETNLPLVGATIWVRDTLIGRSTDEHGFFSIHLPADRDTLEFKASNHLRTLLHVNGEQELIIIHGCSKAYCFNKNGENLAGIGPTIDLSQERLQKAFPKLFDPNSEKRPKRFPGIPHLSCGIHPCPLPIPYYLMDTLGKVKSATFQPGLILHPYQAVKGLVPGLLISQAGNDPWATPEVRMRGFHTLLQNPSPLLLWDDMPLLEDAVIEPAMIREMDVLRDPVQLSRWGLQGGAGALNLKTDRPCYEKIRIRYQGQLSWQQATRLPEVLEAEEYRSFANGDNDFEGNTNWFDEVLRESLSQHHGLQLEGRTGQTRWQVDGHYRRANGVGRNTFFDQLVGHAKIQQHLWKNRLKLSLEGQSGLRTGERDFEETFFQAAKYSPLAPVRFVEQPADPELAAIYTQSSLFFRNYFELSSFRGLDLFNPAAIQFASFLEERRSSNLVRAQGALAISRNWSVQASVAQQTSNRREGEEHRTYAKFRGNPISSQPGSAHRELTEQRLRFLSVSSSLSEYVKGVHLKGTLGYRYQSLDWEYQRAAGEGFGDDDFTYRNFEAFLGPGSNSESELYQENSRLVSFFGELHLRRIEWLYWTSHFQYQGATRLGGNNRWRPYWGTQLELDMTQLAGVVRGEIFKLHASYGLSGNLPRDNTYQEGVFDERTNQIINANPELEGELRRSWNFGMQASLENGRYFATFDYNSSQTTDLVVKTQTVNIFGDLLDQGLNLEQVAMNNRGWELGLGVQIGPKRRWRNQLLWSSYQTRLEELPYTGDPVFFDANGNRVNQESFPGTFVDFIGIGVLSLDEEFGQILGRRLDRSATLEEERLVYEMPFSGGLPEPFDEVGVIGQALPQKSISWQSQYSWKKWRLGFLWRADLGHELANFLRLHLDPVQYLENNPFRPQNYWVTDYSLLSNTGQAPAFSDDYMEKANYLSLDYLEVSHWWNFRDDFNLELSLSAQNFLLWTNYTGTDPSPRIVDTGAAINGDLPNLAEAGQLTPGIDRRNFYPRTRTISLGAVLHW